MSKLQFSKLNHGPLSEFSLGECRKIFEKEGSIVSEILGYISNSRTQQGRFSEVIATSVLLNIRSQKYSSIQKLVKKGKRILKLKIK